jgi:hypothetical protein
MATPGKRIANVAPNSRKAEITHGIGDRDRSLLTCGMVLSPFGDASAARSR